MRGGKVGGGSSGGSAIGREGTRWEGDRCNWVTVLGFIFVVCDGWAA